VPGYAAEPATADAAQMDQLPPRRDYDRRVPISVVLPQLAAPLAVVGDVETARLVFLLTVGANVPIGLAGRAFDGSGVRGDVGALIEWARPCAAWLYAGLLVSLLASSSGAMADALTVAATVSVFVGVAMYVFPGRSTPAGVRLEQRRRTGRSWRHERECFVLGRASRALTPVSVVALLTGSHPLALALILAAATSGLTAASLRPRNARGYESRRSEQESTV